MSEGIIVTTGDLKEDYEVLGPVYVRVSNQYSGLKGSICERLWRQDWTEIAAMKEAKVDWESITADWATSREDHEKAFFVAVQELKKRAVLLGGNAIIGMREQLDQSLGTTEIGFVFQLQMYGTAVRTK